ncbi:MAG: prolyl oligopeptidase family serine peptidase [Phycisphaerales bacterium]
MNRRLFQISAWSALALAAAATAAPPPTEARPVRDDYHGVEIVDEYRWLEGENGTSTPEVLSWTEQQNDYTRGVLDSIPGREKLEKRLRELMEMSSIGTPRMAGAKYFYTKREADQNQPILYVRTGHSGKDSTLLDVNTLDDRGLISLDWYSPSDDGRYLAFGVSRSGDENSTLHILDVNSGEWLADEIPNKVGGVDWLPDSSGFFYSQLEDPDDAYSRQIRFHKVGRHHRADPVLFKQFSTTWGPFAYTDTDAKWMILGYWTGTRSNDLYVIDIQKWFETGEFEKRTIIEGAEATFSGPIVGDTLYMETPYEAPNGRVIAVDLKNPSKENWKTVIPEREDATLRGVQLAEGMLVANYLKNASTAIEKFDHSGKSLGVVELPGIGSGGLSTEEDRTEAFLSYSSFNVPPSIYRIDLRRGTRELWARPDVPVDPELAEVKQVWYTSKDGTKVSMFIVHKKGLEMDGQRPTLLYGYGGFNISLTPSFSATLYPWLEAGGVYAVPNLRGGGEYGDEWHRDGMLERKQNVFDDFIAAGEYLVDSGITSPEHLAIRGGSNGGLLTGTVAVQRPDLFTAAIVAVPLLDMLRYEKFLMARFWVPEYGSAEDPEQFEFIKKYSPYQNIKEGVKYPAMLVTAGENDSRVHPLHARKYAAAIQAATASDPNAEPVMLWVDMDAGHGQGKPLALRVRETADQYAFIMQQTGLLPQREER